MVGRREFKCGIAILEFLYECRQSIILFPVTLLVLILLGSDLERDSDVL